MSTEEWHRVEEIFHAALAQAPAERDRFLLAACRDDEALRRMLDDPAIILYTEDEMPRTYQIWDGQLRGVHLASYNISANHSEPYGNGNFELVSHHSSSGWRQFAVGDRGCR